MSGQRSVVDQLGKRQVLIVDDDRDFVESLTEILETRGYRPCVATNSETALSEFSENQPPVVLLDIRLGGANGMDLVSRFKKNNPDVLCIIMTAYAVTETAIEALQKGAYDYLRKPLNAHELLATLERCFEKLHLEHEKSEAQKSLQIRNRELEVINARLRTVVQSSKGLTLAGTFNPKQLGANVLKEFARNLAALGGSFFILQENQLVLVDTLDPGHAPTAIPMPLRKDSPFDQVMKTQRPLLIGDLAEDRQVASSGWNGYRDNSLLVFPLTSDRGRVLALLSLHNKENPPFTQQDLDLGIILSSLTCETLRAVRATEALKMSEERFRTIFETAQDAIFMKDPSLRYSLVNPIMENLFNRPSCEIIGKTVVDILGEKQGNIIEHVDRRVLQGEVIDREMNISYNGTHRTLHVVKVPMHSPEGQITGICGIARDITERKHNEETLRQSEEKYRTLFEQSRDAIYIENREGNFVDFNTAALELFGYTEQEMLRTNMRSLYLIPSERGRFQKDIEKNGSVKNYETTFKKRNGIEMSCLVSATLRRDKNGEIIGYQGTLRDITERKRLEEQLRQSQKMEAVGQLAGGVAHDFNNLLQAILGYSQLTLSRLKEETQEHDGLCQIVKAAERAASLTRQLLAFSRRQLLHPVELDLNQVIADLIKMLRRVIGEHVELDIVPEPGLRVVRADRAEIELAIMNLCVNARDAMPEGGRIIIETENVVIDQPFFDTDSHFSPGRYVCLSISDTGCGMDQETLNRIYEPFFTTKAVGQGTGLGLATVYGIVKQHGGLTYVESEQGKGTVFKIYLPMVKQERRLVSEPVAASEEGGTETILVAEDDEIVRQLTVQILQRAGYRVLTASNGKETMEIFTAQGDRLDLLILDLVMPGMGGHAVYERIGEKDPKMKVLFTTGYSTNTLRTEFIIKQGLNMIPKPYKPSILLRMVRSILDS